MNLKHITYERLTLEFLSSFDYKYERCVRRMSGGVIFRMFNREYTLNHNDIDAYFQFDTDSSWCITEICPVGPNTLEFGPFWQRLTSELAISLEGRISSHIHNPTIRYFQKVLAHTNFGRGNNNGNVNSKELYFIDVVFHRWRIHTVAFMLAKMQEIEKARISGIMIGGLITTIALGLDFKCWGSHPLTHWGLSPFIFELMSGTKVCCSKDSDTFIS